MKKKIIIALIILYNILLFHRQFQVFFFQDDFLILSTVRVESVSDFFRLFLPRPDVQFYRPLSVDVFFYIAGMLFGLHPAGFHAVVFLVFIICVLLFYHTSRHFFSSGKIRLFMLFFLASSSVSYDFLYAVNNFSYVSGFLMFILLTEYSRNNSSVRNPYILPVLYIAGLMTSEFILTFPLVLFLSDNLCVRTCKIQVRRYLPYILITSAYLFFRMVIFPPDTSGYPLKFGKETALSLRWYFLFFLNWAETMKDQMVKWYAVRTDFFRENAILYISYICNFIFFLMLVIILPLAKITKTVGGKMHHVPMMKLLFFSGWMLITLLPIVFVPSQATPHRGILSFAGFLFLLFTILEYSILASRSKSILTYLPIVTWGIVWATAAVFTVCLNDRVHWVYRRSMLSQRWISGITGKYPALPAHAVFYLPDENSELIHALGNQWGLKAVYGDSSIKTVYVSKIPEGAEFFMEGSEVFRDHP